MENLHLDILLPALAAGIIVLSTHVLLGREVLRRGIIFIDLAIAQIAGFGVIASAYIFHEPEGWLVQLAAVSAALCGGVLFHWTEKRWPDIQEALIGVFFILAATASLLLLASDPHAGEQLQELLVGQILWVSWSQLFTPLVISSIIILVWWRVGQTPPSWLFYGLFALAITVSVQLVGVYLVFATLIVPALTVYYRKDRGGLWIAYGVGIIGYILGLVGSSLMDLPSGALIVWALAITGVFTALADHLRRA